MTGEKAEFFRRGVAGYGRYKSLIHRFEHEIIKTIDEVFEQKLRGDGYLSEFEIHTERDDYSESNNIYFIRKQVKNSEGVKVTLGVYWFEDEKKGFLAGKFKNLSYTGPLNSSESFEERGYRLIGRRDPWGHGKMVLADPADDNFSVKESFRSILDHLVKNRGGA